MDIMGEEWSSDLPTREEVRLWHNRHYGMGGIGKLTVAMLTFYQFKGLGYRTLVHRTALIAPVCEIENRMTQLLRRMVGQTAEYALSLVPEAVKNDGYQCTLTTTGNKLQRSKVTSLGYMLSLDDGRAAYDPAGLQANPTSSSNSNFKLKLPLWTPSVQFYNHKNSSSPWGANIARCYCAVRGILILPVFDRYRGISVGKLELVMTSPNISYACEIMEVCVAFKDGRKVIHHPGQSRPNAVAFSERKGTGTGEFLHRKWGETIALERVQQQFGRSLVDAARNLNVSKSTLKRHCRKLGITGWPSKMMTSEGPVPIGESVQIAGSYITNASQLPSTPAVVSDQLNSEFHGEKSRPACYQQQNFSSPFTAPDPSSTDQFTPGMPRVVSSRQDNLSSVMTIVKAVYEDITIKFKIDLTAGRITDQLKDGVAKRLQLQDGSYEMMYKDDDDDLISIRCDEDVHERIHNLTPPDSKAVKLYLRDKKRSSSGSSKRGVKRRKHYL